MGTISLSLPSDGQTIDAADVNNPLNTIAAEINGQLDNDNIATDADISGTKLLAASTPLSKLDAAGRGGWISGVLSAPNTITYNGNRNYSVVFNSTDLTDEISNGMRLRFTRTVTAPTQCTDLEAGSSQYYSKTSPAGMTFTDDFVVSAWIKLESYTAGTIISRYNGTSGWQLQILATGQIWLGGYNAGSSNISSVNSQASIPLNKWVHVAAQLDMSAFTATTTTSYVMIDGADVAATVSRSGTNPTALVQAGDLQVGAANSTNFFDGKIAQVAVYSAKVTQATITASINQTLSGSETSLISAYSFNNSILDLTSNDNDLTANGSALATNVDSPFSGGANASTAYTAGTTEFGEVFNVSFSTNTTVVVQVPDGYAIPTSGGVSAVAYSTADNPLGWNPIGQLGYTQINSDFTTTSTSTVQVTGLSVTVYIPSGRKVKITVYSSAIYPTSTQQTRTEIWDGVVVSGTRLQLASNSGASVQATPHTLVVFASPSSGTRTYNVGANISTAGTYTMSAAPTAPAFILVELI